jgi:hypothetical protein
MDEYQDSDNNYDDAGERMVSELGDVNSKLAEILAALNSRADFSSWLWVVIVICLLDSWSGSRLDRWSDQAWYSLRYGADFKNITVDKRPLDCDFLHAPLGGKGCQYRKRTNVFGDEQRRALIQQATSVEQQQTYEKEPNSVTVYWDKEEE